MYHPLQWLSGGLPRWCLLGGCLPRGCLPRGGGVYLGVSVWGGVCPEGWDVCLGQVSAQGVVCLGGVCLGQVSAQGGVPRRRGCLPRGAVCLGGCLPKGVSAWGCLPRTCVCPGGGGVSLGGVCLRGCPPTPRGQNDRCLWKRYLSAATVADGN